ncbi:MAG: ECF transporter S component [Candidatus Neomarinimicrobiota bacterium]
MSEQKKNKMKKFSAEFLLEKLQIQSSKALLITLLYSGIAIVIFLLMSLIPQPFIMNGLFKFGLILPLALIPTIAAIRGPLAGFITGYIGTFLFDLVVYRVILLVTIPYLPYGLLGLLIGLANYQINNGKSLAKLAIISTLVYLLSVLLLTIIGLTMQGISILVFLGFVVLPLLGMGIPSIFLLTPLYSRLWHILAYKVYPSLSRLKANLKSRGE